MTEHARKGFFTDTSVCIGCKACEVACKEWNHVPPSNQGFTGDSANDLLGLALDPNVHIGEYKAQTCDVRPGRRPRGAALVAMVERRLSDALGSRKPE